MWRVHYRNGTTRIVRDQAELDRIRAKSAAARRSSVVGIEVCRRHKCDHCGLVDVWTEDWVWYGSVRQLDEDGEEGIRKYCSEAHMRIHHRNARRLGES